MYIYRIGRRFEDDYYLAHETKFSQEELVEYIKGDE